MPAQISNERKFAETRVEKCSSRLSYTAVWILRLVYST